MHDIGTALAEGLKGKLINVSADKFLKITFDPRIISESIEQTEMNWIKKNFHRLNVYFMKSTIEKHEQMPKFGFTDLFSNVGGVLGLWVGVSFIKIFEILVLGCQIILEKICYKNTVRSENLQIQTSYSHSK